MIKISIDTNAYSAFKLGNQNMVDLLQRADYIGISAVVLAELYSGFKLGNKEAENLRELERFLVSPRVHFLLMDEKSAEFYAMIFSGLRTQGTPIPTNDIWLAAVTMQYGLALAIYDKHFSNIRNLLLVW